MPGTEGQIKLSDPVTVLRGVGPKKSASLTESGIETVGDLLRHYPRKYEDRRTVTPVSDLKPDSNALIEAKVVSRRFGGYRYGKKSYFSLLLRDGTGDCEAVFFNGAYLERVFSIGSTYSFYGKVTVNNGRLQFIHPEFHKAGDSQDLRGIIPVYGSAGTVSGNDIRKLVSAALSGLEELTEWLPAGIAEKYKLAGPGFAFRNIHFPKTPHHMLSAKYRLIFEELLCLETGLLYVKQGNQNEKAGISIDTKGADTFIDSLPFRLTEGQARVWEEIAEDLRSPRPMNRLVQGDVGSGKTAVAEIAMYAACCSGYQSVMMAPTEILARQHLEELTARFRPFGIKVGLLVSGLKEKERENVLESLASGEIDILIGTHALIQPDVKFRNLGLVITDEQHRFGVEQRRILSGKGKSPDVMVMTATPIPRTLAVIIYGDLDISVIDSMPAGRKAVRTRAAGCESRDRVYDFVADKVREGDQAYVVTPLIEASDAIDARSSEDVYRELRGRYPDIRTGLLHGNMKQEEKDRMMEEFVRGETDILVSTSVIEVGINVPDATVMVIENCERFGLAQMHQLRGRVGRGDKQSYCFLILGHETDIAKERTDILCSTGDGFVIAEEDLRLRGPGEIFGTRQHGLPELAIADLAKHQDVLLRARDSARSVLADDPELKKSQNMALRERIEKLFRGEIRLDI